MVAIKEIAQSYMACCQDSELINDVFTKGLQVFDVSSGFHYGVNGLVGNVNLLRDAFPKLEFELLQYSQAQDESLMLRWRIVPDSVDEKAQEKLGLVDRDYTGMDFIQLAGNKVKAVQMYTDTPGDLLDYWAMRCQHERRSGYNNQPEEVPNNMSASVCMALNLVLKEDKLYLNPNLRLPQLARVLGVSSNQLSSIVNQRFNKGFNEYLNSFRIKEAQSLIAEDELSLLDVALQSGFNSQAMFNTTFKKAMRLTPGQYRKQCVAK